MGSPNVYFAATRDEFERAAPGWLFPNPNVDVPREVVGSNPFTGEEIRVWSYRNPAQPNPPEASSFPDLSNFRQIASRLLDPLTLGSIAHAIDGSEAAHVAGQIEGQQLISSGEHEVFIMVIPATLCRSVANLDPSAIDVVAERSVRASSSVPRKGILARLFATTTTTTTSSTNDALVDGRRRALREFHDLATIAIEYGRDVFLQQSP